MSADRWLEVAFAELAEHVAEIPGLAANQRIIAYDAVTTLSATSDEVPWCSAFVCWCMEQAGIPSTRSAMARSWLQWKDGGHIEHFRMGAIAVLARGAPGSNQGHVGFALATRAGKIALLAGNQGNRISVEWFPFDRVVGLRWPNGVA